MKIILACKVHSTEMIKVNLKPGIFNAFVYAVDLKCKKLMVFHILKADIY